MPFFDRQRELAALQRAYETPGAQLFALYGRRRVGKSELLRAFCRDKPHIFFVADLSTEAAGLADFTRQVSARVFARPDAIGPFQTWDSALEFIAQQATTQRLVVVLDEFTYLGQINPAVPSLFQRVWDTHLRHGQVMLVLCSSYVGLMERQVLSYRAPLYGRRTGQWHLKPLDLPAAAAFFPAYSPQDLVRVYAVLGGVPAYLQQFSDSRTLADNIASRMLEPGSALHEEPRLLMHQEVSEPARYFSILEAIANKRTRANEIAQSVGLVESSIQFYLATLREIGLVERVVPITEAHPERSKRGTYRIADPFFRFWFRYVYGNRSVLGRGATDTVLRDVEASLDAFTSLAFEEVCREHVWRLAAAGALGFTPRRVGAWWSRTSTDEIDVVAIADDQVLVGECKWSAQPVSPGELDTLVRKSTALLRDAALANHPFQVRHALFSRSGFTPEFQANAARSDVLLVTAEDLVR